MLWLFKKWEIVVGGYAQETKGVPDLIGDG